MGANQFRNHISVWKSYLSIGCICSLYALFIASGWAQVDRDLDGLSDVWEDRIAGAQLEPGDDTDGDGLTNWEESVMGTDPHDSDSGLWASIKPDGDDICVSWKTVSGKVYRPRLHTNLGAGEWMAPDLFVGGSEGSEVTIRVSDTAVTAVEGVLRREHYNNVGSVAGWEFFDWNEPPIGVTWIDHIGGEPFGLNFANNFQQIKGWVTPPETGTYVFRLQFAAESLASRADFLMALDGEPENLVLVASQKTDDTVGHYDVAVLLQAGSPVYVVLRSENGLARSGTTELANVRWQLPGASDFVPIPSSALSLYLPEPIEMFEEDQVDQWVANIEVLDVDSDEDGLSDYEEQVMNLYPFAVRDIYNLANDHYLLGLRSGLYETVNVRITDADTDVTAFATQEGAQGGRRLRVTGLNINSRDRDFSPFSLPAIFGGTATRGVDYLVLGSASLDFSEPNQQMASFDMVLLNDDIPEDDETIEISFDYRPDVDVVIAPGVHYIRDDDRPTFGLEVVTGSAVESPARTGRIRAFRTGDLSERFEANVVQSGTAIEGLDYLALRAVTFLPGESEFIINVVPFSDDEPNEAPETVELRAMPTPGYDLVPHKIEAVVTITERSLREEGLYLATFGPEAMAETDAWGYATLQLAEDENSAIINTRFANLTSPQTVAHVHEGAEGTSGPVVEGLPNGEVINYLWEFGPDRDEILTSLNDGILYANVHSVNYPAGEIRGNFYPVDGSETFTPPASVPQDLGEPGIELGEAHRFLMQATMGPTTQETARVQQVGIAAWLDEQMALPQTLHYDFGLALDAKWRATHPDENEGNPNPQYFLGDTMWMTTAAHSPDQLRRRIVHSLGQILVISRAEALLFRRHHARSHYMDVLGRNALGNFRDLLHDVARNPAMGQYLSHIKNVKADPENGIFPDENFAREVMQLFSIGLFELHPDGTLKLDPATGGPMPTYGTEEITELARVFTGFGHGKSRVTGVLPTYENNNFFHIGIGSSETSFFAGQIDWTVPMKLFPLYHDDAPKRIIGGVDLVDLDGETELYAAIDALFQHPSTGPFIADRLIKRLTTSNPSPGYVYRVAQAFADNGQGVRGDMKAVVRAIFLDAEARDTSIAAQPSSGKFREPLLVLTHLCKNYEFNGVGTTVGDIAAFGNTSDLPVDGILRQPLFTSQLSMPQTPQGSPSVFNYFDPDFVPSGPLGEAQLTHPEGSYLGDVNLFTTLNYFDNFARTGLRPFRRTYFPENDPGANGFLIVPEITDDLEIIDDLDQRLFAGTMSLLLREQLTLLLAQNQNTPYIRALRICLLSPEFHVQY